MKRLIMASVIGALSGNVLADEPLEDWRELDAQLPQTAAKSAPLQAAAAAPAASTTAGGNQKVQLNEVRLTGATVLDSGDVSRLIEQYEGRPVALYEIQELRFKLSEMYANAGYLSSGVRIPDQVVDNGVLELEAVEASLGAIELLPGSRMPDRLIEPRIRREIAGPLNTDQVQTALQRLLRNDHVSSIDARLRPGDQPGESILLVQVEDAPRFDVTLGFDNYRTSSVGGESPWAGVTARNLTGFGETMNLRVAASEGATVGSFSVSVPLNARDTTVSAYYSRSDTQIVEDAFDELDIESLTDTWGVAVSHPLIDTLNNTLTATLGFESKSSETELLGQKFSFSPGAQDGESDSRAAYASIDWLQQTDSHVLAIRGTYRRGLDVLDATEDDGDRRFNPTGADSDFDLYLIQQLFRYRLSSRWPNLNDRAQLVARSTVQFTWDGLMSVDKIAVGGRSSARGYPENLLVRDNGAYASVEVQLPFFGYQDGPNVRNLVVAPFIDYARSWDDIDTDAVSLTRNTDETRYLLSAGVGLLWQPLPGLNASVYWGHDFKDNFDRGEDPRANSDGDLQKDGLHFSITYSLSF